jgi:hypothetical protein
MTTPAPQGSGTPGRPGALVAPRRFSLHCFAALLALLTFTACGGSDDGPTEPEPTPTIGISAAPSSLQIQQGESGEVTVNVSRGGGFTGAVSVTAQNLPDGVQAPSVTVPAGSSSASLTFTASASAPPTVSAAGAVADSTAVAGSDGPARQAPVSVTLFATGTGVDPATASVSLTVTEAPTGSFSVSLDAGSLSIQQGESGSVGVDVSREDPFTGSVSLAVSGAPDGVSATFDPDEVEGTESTLEIAVGAAVAPGDYALTVTGSGDGPDDASAQLTLTVTEAPSGGFSLALDAGTLSLQQGNSGSVGVTISREDPFDGDVSLSVSGAPAGATIDVDPAEVSGTDASVDVTLAGDATTGDHTITVTGTGEGVEAQTASFTLTVTARPAGTDYSWSFCPVVPDWFAVKDGGGAWQEVTPAGDTFDFSAASDRVGVAWVVNGVDGPEVTVQFLGAGEVASVGEQQCPGTKSVTGTTVGVGALDNAVISMGDADAFVTGAAGTDFTLEGVRDGTVDLFGTKSTVDVGSGTFVLDRLYLERGLNPADGSSVTVDFTGADSFDPGSANLTVNGLGGEQAIVTMVYSTPGSSAVLFNQPNPSTAATRPFPTVPAARQEADDLHGLTLTTVPAGASPLGDFRSNTLFFRDPVDRTMTLGPDLGATDVDTGVTAPYLRPRVTYARQAEYGRYYFVNYQQDASDRDVTLVITDDYLDGADIDLIVPDFSGVSGWSNFWGLVPGETMNFAFTASGWPGAGDVSPETLAEGLEILTGFRAGEIVP